MKKLTRALAAVLALCCVLALAACGKDKADDSDMAYVKDKGTLIVGITDFAPMDYRGDNGEWIGFDADMAKKFAEHLGVDVEFQEIGNWDMKATELETKAVDVVWNGMTITDEVKGLMGVSEAYCNNAQVVVVKSDIAADCQTVDAIKSLTFAAENGSAGAAELDALDIEYTAVDTQAKALMEVASGSVQACVIDSLMAAAMVGEGTDYDTLTYTVGLNSEEYGVGFRKNSDLIDEFNSFWDDATADGTVESVAETYGVQAALITD